MAYDLAKRLPTRMGDGPARRIVVLGVGSGRNVPPLVAAGLLVDVVEDDPGRALAATLRFAGDARIRIARTRYIGPLPFAGTYAGALATHALLHGSLAQIAAGIAATRDRLAPGAPFFATLGSTNDPRYGAGERLAAATFAPSAGPECGIAHSFVDAAGARALFAGFVVESLVEKRGGENVGQWAHAEADAATIVHWYVRARRDANGRADQ